MGACNHMNNAQVIKYIVFGFVLGTVFWGGIVVPIVAHYFK